MAKKKKNHQQKVRLSCISVLNSLKTKSYRPKSEKNGWTRRQIFVFGFAPSGAWAEISISLSGQDWLGLKFQFLFRAGPESNRIFFLYFGPGRDEIAAVGGPAKVNSCRALHY